MGRAHPNPFRFQHHCLDVCLATFTDCFHVYMLSTFKELGDLFTIDRHVIILTRDYTGLYVHASTCAIYIVANDLYRRGQSASKQRDLCFDLPPIPAVYFILEYTLGSYINGTTYIRSRILVVCIIWCGLPEGSLYQRAVRVGTAFLDFRSIVSTRC